MTVQTVLTLADLPTELLELIFNKLNASDIINLRLVSKKFFSIIRERQILKLPTKQFMLLMIPDDNTIAVGVRQSDWFTTLLPSVCFPEWEMYSLEETNILEIMNFWFRKLTFEGALELHQITFDFSLLRLFGKHKKQFNSDTRFRFQSVKFDIPFQYVQQLFALCSDLTIIDSFGYENAISFENLCDLKQLHIMHSEPVSFPYLNDEHLEELLPSMSKFKLPRKARTNLTCSGIVKVLVKRLAKDSPGHFTWVFGHVLEGNNSVEDSLKILRASIPASDFVLEIDSSEPYVNNILVYHETYSIYVAITVEERSMQQL